MQLSEHELEQMINLFADHTTAQYAADAKAQVRLMIEHDGYFPMEGLLEARDDHDLEQRVWANRTAAAMALYLDEIQSSTDPDMIRKIEAHLEFDAYSTLCQHILFCRIEDQTFFEHAGKDMLKCLRRHESPKGMRYYALTAFSGHCLGGFDTRAAADFLASDDVREAFCREAENIVDTRLAHRIIGNATEAIKRKYCPKC